MVKKKKADEQTIEIKLDKELELLVLRWEFLRRSPEYIDDFVKLMKDTKNDMPDVTDIIDQTIFQT